jgi:hypothetical protein
LNTGVLERARRVQRTLERFYELERGPDVADFVRPASGPSSRETLLVRHTEDGIELALILPMRGDDTHASDTHLQVIEGVSHFVYVAERARVDLPATALELELQAEVDKFVLLAFEGETLVPGRALAVRHRLFEEVEYLDAADSEPGHRYRLANSLAARIATRVAGRRARALRFLRQFYRSGQTEKIRLAHAA